MEVSDPAAAAAAAAAHAAAAARLAVYAAALDAGPAVRRGEGWFAVVTGVASNDLNGVVAGSPDVLTDGVLHDVLRWISDAGVPASLLVPDPGARLTSVLLDHGAEPERTGWWSTGPVTPATPPEPLHRDEAPALVHAVTTTTGLDTWLDVADRCGWIDDDADRRARADLYRAVGLDHPRLRHWVAVTADDGPVGMASSFLDRDVVDLCNLGVVESAQRRGIGTALARLRLDHGATAGATHAVSALSPDGWELYRGLGFRTVPVVADTWFYLPTATT